MRKPTNEARRRLVETLADSVASNDHGANILTMVPGANAARTARGVAGNTIDSYFQRSPLTMQQMNQIFGTSDEFLNRYNNFAERYYSALTNRSNLAKGIDIDPKLEKAMGRIDLTMLNVEKQKELYDLFTRDVMRLDDLIRIGGLPGAHMPTANSYSESFRYLVGATAPGDPMHAAGVVLNATYFSHNERRMGMEGFTLGKKRIMSQENILAVMRQLDTTRGGSLFDLPAGSPGRLRIATLDIESTGVFKFSQARSFSIAEQIYENGQLSAPSVVRNMSTVLDSPQLGGIIVGGRGGQTTSLSSLLSDLQRASHGDPIPLTQALDRAADLFETLNTYDRVVGHNIGYDLEKLTDTFSGIDGFASHDRLKTAMTTFYERKQAGGFVFDTLDIARQYLNDKAMSITEQYHGQADLDAKTKSYINNLLSQEFQAKVHVGGSAAPFSMENISLNTNLFHLIERDGQAQQVFDLIKKGSHVDDTDTVLQGYVAKYIQSGELDIQTGITGRQELAETAFTRVSKARILQSAAITPTTNIADVSQLSDQAFDYMRRMSDPTAGIKGGLSGVSINFLPGTDSSDLVRLIESSGLENELLDVTGGTKSVKRGILKFTEDNAVIFTTKNRRGNYRSYNLSALGATQDAAAKGLVQTILEKARNQETLGRVNIAGRSEVIDYGLLINDLGKSYQTVSRFEQMRSTLNSVGRNVAQPTPTSILDTFGSVYREYGSGLSSADRGRFSTLIGRPEDLPFEAGLGNFGSAVPAQVAAKFASIGDPFYFVDPYSRVLSTAVADITSSIGIAMNRGEVRKGFTEADLAFSAQPKQTAELGISYFRAQDQSSIFRLVSTPSSTSKIVAPTEIVQRAFDDIMGANVDTMRNVGFSIYKPPGGEGNRVNLVWNISEQLDDTQQDAFVKRLMEIYEDSDQVAKILGKNVDELDQSIIADINQVRAASARGTKADLESKVKGVLKRGIVMGHLDDTAGTGKLSLSERFIRTLERMGIDFSNDQTIKSLRTSVLRTGAKEGVVLAPITDVDAIGMDQELSDAFQAATRVTRELVTDDQGVAVLDEQGNQMYRIVSESVQQYNAISNELADKGLLRQVTRSVGKAKLGDPSTRLTDFYVANKAKIGIGAAVAAVAGFAYYKTKKRREEDLYNQTMEAQPIENIRQIDPLEDVKATYNYAPINSNPLATTSVVGNLDRNKIGHTRMGNDRNNHLFGLG